MQDQSEASTATLDLMDRRRQGRPAEASPALIPLLRGTLDPVFEDAGPAADPQLIEFGDPDHLRPAQGLATGLLMSGVIWGALAVPVWWFLS